MNELSDVVIVLDRLGSVSGWICFLSIIFFLFSIFYNNGKFVKNAIFLKCIILIIFFSLLITIESSNSQACIEILLEGRKCSTIKSGGGIKSFGGQRGFIGKYYIDKFEK